MNEIFAEADALIEAPYHLLEQDDIHKLGLSPGAVAYARRTSKSMGRQPQQWANVQMSILNKGVPRKGFHNSDVGAKDGKGSALKF